MKVDMQILKQLRDSTLASLKDCKEALVEANWDLDKAHDILKKSWAMKAAKKADRETNEWIVKFIEKDGKHVWIKLLCETDFVAKNETFQELVDSLLEELFSVSDNVVNIEKLSSDIAEKLNNMVTDAIVKIGENLRLADVYVGNDNSYIYNHPWNKVASIVYYQWEWNFDDLAKEIALQVAAMSPTYLTIDEVPHEEKNSVIAWEREKLLESWKPENMVDQILEWKIKKALSDVVLLEQEYIRDPSKKIKDIMPWDFVLKSYIRWSI